ncbi:MAG: hypothetical protein ACJ76D_09815 [Solirubrobacterales bacterium]
MSERRKRIVGSILVSGAVALIAALALAATSGAQPKRHHRKHRVCRVVKVRGKRHRVHRARICATRKPIGTRSVDVHHKSGGFPRVLPPVTEEDEGEEPKLPVGPYRPPRQPATQVSLGRAPAAPPPAAARAVAGASGIAVTSFSTQLLSTSFPASVWNETGVQAAQEPSVAAVGRLVMYTLNWSAGYSRDGGQTFTEIDPATTFPSEPGGFCCDQVVMYDPQAKRFIWVLQYIGEGGENVIRVAWTSPANLVRFGAGAWSWFDLPSRGIVGKGFYLDQPKLGLTPRYLYMNINQGDKDGVHKTAVVRIPRAAFAGTIGMGYGYALLSPWSLRVAQNVSGPTEYFVGHKNTSTLRVASIDDDANYLLVQDIKDQTIADRDWSMTTPGGDDLLNRQSVSQGTQISGVTQDGEGNLWAAWSEGRDIRKDGREFTPSGAPTQPHIAVVALSVKHPKTGPPPVIALKSHWAYWNVNYALAMPDLATTASGDVAFVYDWGGGTRYLNHAVGFVNGGFSSVTVAESTADPTQKGNPAGDYQTVRPLAPPYGDCLYAAGVVNGTGKVGSATLTLFSRSGVNCRFKALPVQPPPPTTIKPPTVQAATSLALNCPGQVPAGQPYEIGGFLNPALVGLPISIAYTSSSGGSPAAHTVSTGTYGHFADTAPPGPAGTETVDAKFAGNADYGPSEAICHVAIEPVFE